MSYKTKKILKLVAMFLAGVLVCAGFLHIGGNDLKTDFFEKELNDDNLIKVANYMIKDEENDIGVDFEVDEDTGVIKLSGKAEGDYTANVVQLELEAGTYTISGFESETDRCCLIALYDVDQTAISGKTSATFTLAEAQTVTVQIVIKKDASFNFFTARTFEPCLVAGDKAGSLFDK